MKTLSVNHQGRTFFVVSHGGEPWVPLMPLCRAFSLDIKTTLEWTLKGSEFGAISMDIVGIEGTNECVCIPLRKLFGWLVQFADANDWSGLDDALHAAVDKDRAGKFAVSGRVMVTLRDGCVSSLQHVPDDWMVGSFEYFNEMANSAGYRVLHESVHDLMYEPRV